MKDLITAFEWLGKVGPPGTVEKTFDTACVLGGGIAGLFAARVLADHSSQVVVIERDFADDSRPRDGVPQGRQVHTLLPGGQRWIERWLPEFTREIQDGGGVFGDPAQLVSYIDSHPMVPSRYRLLMASRPFLEAGIRRRVLGMGNVSVMRAQATGLEYQDGEVAGVRYTSPMGTGTLPAEFVVDAMGRASRLADWLSADGYDRPELQRLPTAINYATALFQRDRKPEELDLVGGIARFGPPYPVDGVAVAAINAIEDDRWMMMLVGYDDVRPGRTLDVLRAACAKLPLPFAEAAGNALTEDIATYHQADSRRRGYASALQFPARLVSVGDAVASFNPIYGQGISSAALHAACLAEFLCSGPDLHAPARGFFESQDIVVDAAWAISAGSDAARLDVISGAEVPTEVRQQRWAMEQIMRGTLVDEKVSQAFEDVAFMIAHPATLADPALIGHAVAVNSSVPE